MSRDEVIQYPERYDRRSLSVGASTEAALWIKRSSPSAPAWARFITGQVDDNAFGLSGPNVPAFLDTIVGRNRGNQYQRDRDPSSPRALGWRVGPTA